MERLLNPTEEQVKEFWEWCGFEHIPAKYCESCKRWEGEYWIKKGIGRRFHRPELLVIDLNNLFVWAVPKAVKAIGDTSQRTDEEAMTLLFSLWLKEFWTPRTTPISIEDALFWAIYKVMEKK